MSSRGALPALGDMGRGAALAGVDDFAREQGVAPGAIARRLGERGETPSASGVVEVGLRPVEGRCPMRVRDQRATRPASPPNKCVERRRTSSEWSAFQASSSRGFVMAAPDRWVGGKSHPRLTLPRRFAQCAARWTRRLPDERRRQPGAIAKPKRQGGWRSLLLFVLAAWVLRSLIVAPFSIPSGSMLPTMAIGDYLFVHKWPYGYSRFSFPFQFPSFEGRCSRILPERGDIVVFRPPGQEGRRLRQARDRPSRRHDRGQRRHGDPQRHAARRASRRA